jgi:hypothetical protein
MRVLFLALAALGIAGSAFAQTKNVEGLPIDLGDSIPEVQAALGTAMEPEPSTSVQPDTKELRLKSKGISVFFDRSGKAYNIRLDAPFKGSIKGIKIGDSRVALVQKFGEPVRVIKSVSGRPVQNRQEPYIYYIDDRTTARFDFDRDDVIETVFIVTARDLKRDPK